MKRMVLIAGMAFSILSCAQHDPKSPDTSGNDPQNPNRETTTTTGDTANGGRGGTNYGGTNMKNDGTNNNQTVTTGDSSINKNRQQ